MVAFLNDMNFLTRRDSNPRSIIYIEVYVWVTLDPKLTFLKHLETKMAKKAYLFKRIKGMKINSIRINSILFKSLIRSLSDYAFIPLSSSTQKIMNKLQTLQTRTLRQIKYFQLKTKTSAILGYFN